MGRREWVRKPLQKPGRGIGLGKSTVWESKWACSRYERECPQVLRTRCV
jgi:hypothetical protein